MIKIPGFTIEQVLYEGSKTTVFSAIRDEDQQAVVLKTTSSDYPDEKYLARMRASYSLLKEIKHKNIPQYLDLKAFNNRLVLVVENTGGKTLQRFLSEEQLQSKGIDLELFFDIALQLVDALEVLHKNHIIHKDINPSNIVINERSGDVQLIDFDIATKVVEEQSDPQTFSEFSGTLGYISPEQTGRMNRKIDYRTDFYSLGITFYQLLSGHKPFQSDDPLSLVHAHIAENAVPLHEVNPDIPIYLSQLIEKLMAKSTEDRYQGCDGLRHDLSMCETLWAEHSEEVFPLGSKDQAKIFKVPDKLVGREAEMADLLAAFEVSLHAGPLSVFVSGPAGVGKTSLVLELLKPVSEKRALFVSGKFEKYSAIDPYDGIVRALSAMVNQILRSDEITLEGWKKLFSQRLESSAGIISGLIPSIKTLFDATLVVEEIDKEASKNQVLYAISELVNCVITRLPIVIFLDDLQWADEGTIGTLRFLLHQVEGPLLLIGALRSEEVSDSHVVNELIESAAREKVLSKHIQLEPLSGQSLNVWLGEKFGQDPELVELLDRLAENTLGNPFYIQLQLNDLVNQGYIFFDEENDCWNWLRGKAFPQIDSESAADLLVAQFRALPQQTQSLVSYAACMGTDCTLSMLASITSISKEVIDEVLWPAFEKGVLVTSSSLAIEQKVRFKHDKILQAAYESLTGSERAKIHWRIAESLYDEQDVEQQLLAQEVRGNRDLFTITEHYNLAFNLIDSEAERLRLFRLNLATAEQAIAVHSFDVALSYLRVAESLLPEDFWQSSPDRAYELYRHLVDCEYFFGDVDAAEKYLAIAMQKCHSKAEKGLLIRIQMAYYVRTLQNKKVLEIAIAGLELIGIRLPKKGAELAQLCEEKVAEVEAREQEILDLIASNTVITGIDPEWEAVSGIIFEMSLAAQLCDEPLLRQFGIFQGIIECLNRGASVSWAVPVTYYISHLCSQKRYRDAHYISRAVIEQIEKGNITRGASNIYLHVGFYANHLGQGMDECIELCHRGYKTGLELGELSKASFCFSNITVLMYAKGVAFSELDPQIGKMLEINRFYKNEVAGANHYYRLLNVLRGNTEGDDLTPESFGTALWEAISKSAIVTMVHYLQFQEAFWLSSDDDEILQKYEQAEDMEKYLTGTCIYIDRLVQGTLLFLRLSRKNAQLAARYAKTIESNRALIKSLAGDCPENFHHKYLLVEAEFLYLKRERWRAQEKYEAAIEAAKLSGFLQYQALANELCGRFWYENNNQTVSKTYFQEAIYFYRKWGANAVAERVDREYSQQLQLLTLESPEGSRETSGTNTLRSGDYLAKLDMATMLRVSQTIFEDISLKGMLENMVQVVAESSGAQNAIFLAKGDDQLSLMASFEDGQVEVLQLEPLAEVDRVCHGLVRFVFRSGESVILGDATQEGSFIYDPYVQKEKPKSVLCTPMRYQGEVQGVLYLENNRAAEAFQEKHLVLLNILLSQIGVAFQNAQTHYEMERRIEERTNELSEANRELESFSYSVSHDLRSPLHKISGFADAVLEDYGERLDDEGRSFLNYVIEGTHEMTEIIDGLLELSQTNRANPSVDHFDLSEMVAQTVAALQQDSTIAHYHFDIQDNIFVYADKGLLKRVVDNLLSNAIKYSRKTEQPQVEFGGRITSKRVTCYIRDNGSGFDSKVKDKLFQPFSRLHGKEEFEGSGIGLAIVKRIIERHGGRIWAESELGQGATFYFTLPVVRPV